MREKIDKVIKNKVKKVEIPKDTFDYNFLPKRGVQNRYILNYVAAMILFALMLVSSFVVYNNFKPKYNEDSIVSIDGEYKEFFNNACDFENVSATTRSLPEENNSVLWDDLNFNDMDYILIIKLTDISYYDLYNNKNIIPSYTKARAEIINTIKGNKESEIEFFIPFGIANVSALESSTYLYNREKYASLSDDEKSNTFIKVLFNNGLSLSEPIEDKIYVVCLVREEINGSNELCVATDIIYNFKEYDMENNLVMNQDGEWEVFDIEKIRN